MKRICSVLLAFALCLSLALPAFAAEGKKVPVSQYHGGVIVDGERTVFQLNKDSARSPLVCNGTLYIPFMAAGQWLGADVSYNETAGVVTIAHNGREPVFYTQGDLREKEIIWDDWEGLEYPDKPQEAQLLDKVMIVVDGIPHDFVNAQGEIVRPLRFGEYVLLPLEAVSELMDKRMTEFPEGFANYVYLYDAPTREELNETDAYLAAVRGHLDAVRAIVKGAAPKTGEEYTAKVRQMQEHLKAVWTLPEPVLDCMKPFAERLRYQAGLVLWQHIDSHLPLEENSGARPSEDSGSVRPVSWVQVKGSDGKTWYEPGPPLAEVELDPKDWADFAQQMITEEAGVITYFLELEGTCANSEAFLAEVKSDPIGAAAFRDAADITHWDAVATLVQLGVIDGKEDGSYFDPAGTVTRAEAAKLIFALAHGGDTQAEPSEACPFPDSVGHWAETYITWCAQEGIITGRSNGGFDPDGQVTGLELGKMALVLLGYDPQAYALVGRRWESNTEELCQMTGLDGELASFDQETALTRDECAQLLFNTLDQPLKAMLPDNNSNQEEPTYSYQSVVIQAEITPESPFFKLEPYTILRHCFGLTELPTIPAQPAKQ